MTSINGVPLNKVEPPILYASSGVRGIVNANFGDLITIQDHVMGITYFFRIHFVDQKIRNNKIGSFTMECLGGMYNRTGESINYKQEEFGMYWEDNGENIRIEHEKHERWVPT